MNAGKTEHIKDAARVLSRVVDAIGVRAFAGLENLEDDLADPVISAFARYADVPVLNMESALYHRCRDCGPDDDRSSAAGSATG